MTYVLEWQIGEDRSPTSLMRQVRVFKNANGLKAFLRSRAFRRRAGPELRLMYRSGESRQSQVITTIEAALGWDPIRSRLPPPLVHAIWTDKLTALSVRALLVERLRKELVEAKELGLLSLDDVDMLVAALEAMLAAQELASGGSERSR
jgi:hypothetical protein